MFIKNFGQFWRADEVEWFPGSGTKGAFRLLGRQGKNFPGLRLADFRHQQGIYILYSNHGPYYTGLTTKQGLGKRLQDHLTNDHQDCWDRFSWFGFRSVLSGKDEHSLRKLKKLASVAVGEPTTIIKDVEALLIRAMGLTNIAQAAFSEAEEWTQVKLLESANYLNKISGDN